MSALNDFSKINSEKTKNIENNVAEILEDTREIKTTLLQYSFHVRMETADIAEYFPIKSDEDLNKFMLHDDQWSLRKKVRIFYLK